MKRADRHTFRILLYGYYGCGNMGDDALPTALLRTFSERLPHVSITVALGKDGDALRCAIKECGASVVPRRSPRTAIALLRADALVFGGGSILQNKSGQASLVFYLALLRLAMLLKKKTAILSGGLGPICGDLSRKMTARVLRRLDYASFRDADAQAEAARLGVRSPRLSADLAFLLPKPQNAAGAFLPPRFFLVSVKDGNDGVRIMAERIFRRAEALRMPPVFCLPFPREDATYTDAVCASFGRLCRASGKTGLLPQKLPALPWEALYAAAARASFVLTARYHLAVFAHAANVPFAVIGDDPKLSAIARERRSVAELGRAAKEDVRALITAFSEQKS